MIENLIESEVEPTFFQLCKLFWSQSWRCFLLLLFFTPLILMILNVSGALIDINLRNYSSILLKIFDSIFVRLLIFLPLLYTLQYFLFHLIIGIKYSNFELCVFPKSIYRSNAYWHGIRRLTWAYFWRTNFLLLLIDEILKELLPDLSSILLCMISLTEVVISIIMLRFVINKQYGEIRFSLQPLPDSRGGANRESC